MHRADRRGGIFLDGFGWLTGHFAGATGRAGRPGPQIVGRPGDKGLLYRAQHYTHRYPHCWRCGTELVFRLVDEWFIRMDEPARPDHAR